MKNEPFFTLLKRKWDIFFSKSKISLQNLRFWGKREIISSKFSYFIEKLRQFLSFYRQNVKILSLFIVKINNFHLFLIIFHEFYRIYRENVMIFGKMSLFFTKMAYFYQNMAKNDWISRIFVKFHGYLWALTAPIEPAHGSHRA